MYIEVDLTRQPAEVRLQEADNFLRFSVEIAGPAEFETACSALASIGTLIDCKEARISPDGVRRLAGRHLSAEWERSFETMLWHAREAGWIDDEASGIRAHCEWSGA